MLCQELHHARLIDQVLSCRPVIIAAWARRAKLREGKRGRKGKRSPECRVNPNFHEKLERRVNTDGGSMMEITPVVILVFSLSK
jgi:hypothetical protein